MMNQNEAKEQRSSSYFSSRAFGPFRLGSSRKTLSSPGMITCRPVPLPGLKQKITHTDGSFPFSALENCLGITYFQRETHRSGTGVQQKTSKPQKSERTDKKKEAKRRGTTNHQNTRVYQTTDLFKTHGTAFGSGTLQYSKGAASTEDCVHLVVT